jgi:alkanesulfonate monooxygenase SsuD/methylene tetrahydromethanopterin reductase-like flavin-dependent oxidoreductase (luciferase family)
MSCRRDAILGIGAAWNEAEARAYGYDWPPVVERFELLEDALQICRSMFTQEKTTFKAGALRSMGR